MIRNLVLCAMILCAASPARAQVVSAFLKWNNCAAEGGVLSGNFDCNSNAGSEQLIASFVVTGATLPVTTIDAVIDIAGQDYVGIADPFGGPPIPLTPLGSWWDLRMIGGSRASALAVNTDFSESPFAEATQCTDYWAGQAIGTHTYRYALDGDPGRARIIIAFAVSPSTTLEVPVDGHEYYAFRVNLGHARTIGANAVDGCCTKAVLALSHMILTFSDGSTVWSQSGYFDVVASRQHEAAACAPTPAHNHTWGALKQLYR